MKRLLFAVLTLILIVSSIAVAVSIPLANPQSAAAEEPESGVIVLNQYTEAEYTGNSSIDEETGQTVYEYRANISSVPLYLPDLQTRIDPRFHWNPGTGTWQSGANIFDLIVNGSQVTAFQDGEEFQWDPIVYIGGQVIEAPDNPKLIAIDPTNENYQNNILEWDYDVCIRQLRLTEGQLVENYIFNEDPCADVRIDSNAYKTPNFIWLRDPYGYDAGLNPIKVIVDDNGKTVNASEFADAIYPVVVDDSIGGTDYGSLYCMGSSYGDVWSRATADENTNFQGRNWIGQALIDGTYFVERNFLYYDTSSISTSATITSAQISLLGNNDTSATDFNIVVQTGMPSHPEQPLSLNDYYKGYYSGNGGQLGTGSFSGSGYNYISLNPTWVQKGVWTKLCLRSSRDIAGTQPSGDEFIIIMPSTTLTITFISCLPLITPQSPSPSSSALGISVNADLSWYGNADSYEVYFSTYYQPSYYYYTTVTSASCSLDTLSEYTHYYWQIKAIRNCDSSYVWGPVWEFETGAAPCTNPGAFDLASPSNGAPTTINPYLDWSDSSGVSYYNVYIDTHIYPDSKYTSTEYWNSELYPSLAYGTLYYWRVEAVHNCGSSTSSTWSYSTRTFTTESAPPTYTLTTGVSSGSGWVSPSSGSTYDANTVVEVTAHPTSGWSFAGWSGAASGTSNPVYITMNSNKAVYATFTQNPIYYTLTTSVVGSGSITPAPGTHTYTIGTPVTLTATPADGWTFSSWSGSLSGTTNPTSINMNGNKAVTATFTYEPWSFAIITDLHVGESGNILSGVTNYGGTGWDDGDTGEENNITNKLSLTVYEINQNIEQYKIKFVVILGDITDSAETSEILKAKSILSNLNVPWIPLIGNHDVWPYSSGVPEAQNPIDADNNAVDYWIYSKLIGPQYNNLSSTYNWNWTISDPVQETASGPKWCFTNLAFDYRGYHFIGSDFNDRDQAPLNNPGVSSQAKLNDFVDYIDSSVKATWPWFKTQFDIYFYPIHIPLYRDVILLSHHPMYQYYGYGFSNEDLKTMATFLNQPDYNPRNNSVAFQFYGHLHGVNTGITFTDWDKETPFGFQAVQTSENKGLPNARIVQISTPGSIDWTQIISFWDQIFNTDCPVDMIITDPDGLTISKEINQIPGAIYSEEDNDGDGVLDDSVLIKDRKTGNYSIQVIAAPNASPSDIYTLITSQNEDNRGFTTIVLAENVSIENIPAEPYTYEYKQRITTTLNYSGDTSGYRFDSVGVNAVLTTEVGSPILEKTVNFTIGNQSASAVTDSNGVATASLTLNQTPSEFYYIEYGFDGDMDYLPFYDSRPFEIMNRLPVADAGGPYTGNEGSSIIFNGSSSYDLDSTIISYEWDFGDGSSSITGTAIPTHTYIDNGTYNVTLIVTDDYGLTNTSVTTSDISNVAPTVNAGPDIASVLIGSSVSFNGSFTDPGTLDTHTIAWDFGDGTATVTDTLTPSHVYSVGGDYTVTLTVTDDDGGTGTDTVAINVNVPPVANPGGPYTADEGSPITFNGSTSYDPDGTIVSYELDFGDGSSTGTGPAPTHAYGDNGTYTVTLTVTDNNGATGTVATTTTIANVAPAVNAGPDVASVLIGSSVRFNGSFTDPGWLDTHTIAWDFGDGTSTVTGTLTPSHTYSSDGGYTVTLTVTDDDGGIGTDTLTVHVNNAPVPDTGGPYAGNEGSVIAFNGSTSYDPDGIITIYSWNFGDGTPLVAGNATPTHVYGDNGTYTVTLTVTDNNGAVSTAATTATIANVAPIVNAGPDMEDVPIGSIINFNGSFTDPGWLDTHTIAWDFGDETPVVMGTLTPSHAYASGGDYIVTLTVTDDDGGIGTDTAAINVNVPPVSNPGGPYTGNEGSPITFNGSASYDTDGMIVSYEWDLDNDGEYDDATGATPSFTWNDDYSGIVGLRVTDDAGEATAAATTVTVNNVAPTVDAGANVEYVLSGSPVSFSGGFTDPGTGDTHTIEWNFGDGTPIVTGTLTPTHTYTSGGDYTVTLTVTDDDGGVGSDTITVHVNAAPIANPAGPYTGDEGAAITFDGSASYDPDGTIVSYEWDLDDDGDFSDAQGAIIQNTWPDDYSGNIGLKVTDDEGATGFATTTVTINNVAPIAEAGPDQNAECCVTEVAFSGSFTDPGIPDTHTVNWDFGDGATASGTLSPTHTYCDPGVYTVTLTVTDDDGGIGTYTMSVAVTDTISPEVSIASPEDSRIYINTQGPIAITYTAVDTCDQTPDVVTTLDGDAIDGDSIDPSVLELGGHTLTVIVTDSSGNVATASATFIIKPQLTAWGRTWGFLEWSTCGHPTTPADFFGSYSYPLETANDSIYSWINTDDSSYWRHTGYQSLPVPWEQSQLFVYKITQDRSSISNLSITWTGHGGNGDLIYHTRLKIWNYQTGSWCTLVDVTSPGSKTFQTYDRGITTNAADFIEAGTGNVSILVTADDDGRGLTEDTEGIFTDYIALNANAAHTPSSPLTTTYTFSSGGDTNKWCWEGHVHMIDWNSGHPVSPADFANSYGYAAGGSSAYSALAASDDSRWKSDISHDLGCCSFDRNCELFKFNITENSSSITNIGLKWEGHGTTGETIYYTTLKIWNPSSGAWEQLHNQQNTTSDVTWIDNIAGDCSDYIDATGNLYVLASSQRSGLPGNCGIWTDYIEVTITQ
ncbi:MAG: PKD domain-containing protein [Dehalococcoidia bacterium]